MNILTVTLLLLFSINIAYAEEGIIKKLIEYDVEVIIFEDPDARYVNSEDWMHEVNLAAAEKELNQNIENNNEVLFENIKPKILTKEYKRINNSNNYNVLYYVSWRQTGLDKKKAFEINIDELENIHKLKSNNTLTGKFRLELARYLHIYGNMEYKRNQQTVIPAESTVPTNTQIEVEESDTALKNDTFPMKIHRRMRSKELHYIDHPLVGIIIQINPVKISTEEITKKDKS